MKLSVIVPVYKVEAYLAQCLDSILSQSLSHELYEIIIINDGSPDGSLQIAERYQAQYDHIKVISQENAGIAAARNTGIRAAEGEYIVLLDSDDLFASDVIPSLVKVIDERQPDLIMSDFNYYYEEPHKEVRVKRPFSAGEVSGLAGLEAVDLILSKEPMYSWYPWVYVVRRSLVMEHALFFVVGRNYEDMMWSPLLFFHAQSVVYMDLAIINYRQDRDGQITRTKSLKNITDPFYAPKFLKEVMTTLQIDDSLQQKIMVNVANKYFIAPIYGGLLTGTEQKQLVRIMKENRYLLDYAATRPALVIRNLIKMFGFKTTLRLVGGSYRTYQHLTSGR